MDNFCDMLQTFATSRVFVVDRCSLASRLQDCAHKREVKIGLIAGLGICFGIGGRWPRSRAPRPVPSTAGLSRPPVPLQLSPMPMPQPGRSQKPLPLRVKLREISSFFLPPGLAVTAIRLRLYVGWAAPLLQTLPTPQVLQILARCFLLSRLIISAPCCKDLQLCRFSEKSYERCRGPIGTAARWVQTQQRPRLRGRGC
jgi:hypothetical protein